MFSTTRTVLGFLTTLVFVTTAQAETADNALHLSVHTGYVGAGQIMKTNYTEAESMAKSAIRLGENAGVWPSVLLELQNNLCVSQIMQDKKQSALKSCQEAVSQAKRLSPRISQSRRRLQSIKAIAFSNRGVLRLLDKDVEGARADFNAALNLRPELDSATQNLNVVNRPDIDRTLAQLSVTSRGSYY